jgi:hypothetical protein
MRKKQEKRITERKGERKGSSAAVLISNSREKGHDL